MKQLPRAKKLPKELFIRKNIPEQFSFLDFTQTSTVFYTLLANVSSLLE